MRAISEKRPLYSVALSDEKMESLKGQPEARVWPTKLKEVSRISIRVLRELGLLYEYLYSDKTSFGGSGAVWTLGDNALMEAQNMRTSISQKFPFVVAELLDGNSTTQGIFLLMERAQNRQHLARCVVERLFFGLTVGNLEVEVGSYSPTGPGDEIIVIVKGVGDISSDGARCNSESMHLWCSSNLKNREVAMGVVALSTYFRGLETERQLLNLIDGAQLAIIPFPSLHVEENVGSEHPLQAWRPEDAIIDDAIGTRDDSDQELVK